MADAALLAERSPQGGADVWDGAQAQWPLRDGVFDLSPGLYAFGASLVLPPERNVYLNAGALAARSAPIGGDALVQLRNGSLTTL